MKRATGSFEVTLQPLSNADASGNPLPATQWSFTTGAV